LSMATNTCMKPPGAVVKGLSCPGSSMQTAMRVV
jgi:hypothetical protein